MIAEFLHRSEVQKYQQNAYKKVILLEGIHQLNSIIHYKLQKLTLIDKKKITYKNKNYVKSAIQYGAKGAMILMGSTFVIGATLVLVQILSAWAQLSIEFLELIATARQIISTIAASIAGIGGIIIIASQIYGALKWSQLKQQVQKQVQDLDIHISKQIDFFNKIAEQIQVEGLPFGPADIDTIKQKQEVLLKQL